MNEDTWVDCLAELGFGGVGNGYDTGVDFALGSAKFEVVDGGTITEGCCSRSGGRCGVDEPELEILEEVA